MREIPNGMTGMTVTSFDLGLDSAWTEMTGSWWSWLLNREQKYWLYFLDCKVDVEEEDCGWGLNIG